MGREQAAVPIQELQLFDTCVTPGTMSSSEGFRSNVVVEVPGWVSKRGIQDVHIGKMPDTVMQNTTRTFPELSLH